MRKIKPCPFCGSTASVKSTQMGYFKVVCDNGQCQTHFAGWMDKDLAIREWNMRLKPRKEPEE